MQRGVSPLGSLVSLKRSTNRWPLSRTRNYTGNEGRVGDKVKLILEFSLLDQEARMARTRIVVPNTA